MNRGRTVVLLEIAMMAAFAMVLDFIDSQMKMVFFGMSLSFSMVPVLLLSLRRGVQAGMAAGFLWGLLQIALGDAAGSIVHPLQGFLDYAFAFTLIGLAGLRSFSVTHIKVILFSAVGIFARYFIHFISGWVYFGAYAPKGQPAWLYSLVYNGQVALINGVTCIVILLILFTVAPKLFKAEKL
ncbi:energy-coupled thiamine transporter ThiT [Macrococcus armenti]|uniref:energy-coupled thiamine transporter ThiT n=1 Tax=Macrococcus armenti TaxID=2875764 RepID=UPI001CCB616E|nr:energy-coupled thiamine transporter ThiT [Macrococcus armenti]UBH14735.1 energy-coupled thiamine transporter ThiT [Macrococcus armenti]UBH17093.1 energy-coupled thiamine transporter ThiT [Macrococcus armenti]UBH19359.1 energy-coupled thiamine transporter ThiT [Macrococcus armenti]